MTRSDAPRRRRNASTPASENATLAEVSRAAGVSTATVSRMLNAPELVSAKTRRVIQREIDRLGYTPNAAARALVMRRSNTIGAIVPTFSNLRASYLLDSFQRGVEAEGYELIVTSFERSLTNVRQKAETLVQRGVDAMLLVNAQDDVDFYEFLKSRKLPFVTTWEAEGDLGVPSVCYDYRKAAVIPAEYLADLGHRDFAVLTGHVARNRRLLHRLEAIRDALAKRGIALPPDRVVEIGSYDLPTARHGFQMLRERGPLPTAIVASNDILAAGAILECLESGISVPGDISVIGFGDFPISSIVTPKLTTMRLPGEEQGTMAASYLARRLRGENVMDLMRVDAELIVRASNTPPSWESKS